MSLAMASTSLEGRHQRPSHLSTGEDPIAASLPPVTTLGGPKLVPAPPILDPLSWDPSPFCDASLHDHDKAAPRHTAFFPCPLYKLDAGQSARRAGTFYPA
jgi:hypothetical protein